LSRLELDVGRLDELGVALGVLDHQGADLLGSLRRHDHVDGPHLGDHVLGLGKLDQLGVELGHDVLVGTRRRHHQVPDGNVGARISELRQRRDVREIRMAG
jgi:hypothetical protein